MIGSQTEDGPDALAGIINVSRETIERLERLVELVRKWQPAENLVGPATLASLWRRHIADSAQVVPLFPRAQRYLDLGSGAGFPGIVIAIVSGAPVELIESNRRKCAFLREAIRITGAPATVHEGRIESAVASLSEPPEVITARALAPLKTLIGSVEILLTTGAVGAFHKGREHRAEIAVAATIWDFDLEIHRSRVDSDGVILEIHHVTAKAAG